MIKPIIKIIILPDTISINKIHTMTNGRNQIKTMIGSHQRNTVKIGAIIINSRIKALKVQGITMGIVTLMIKMNLGITKIAGWTNNLETTRDRAIKNAMTSILTTIKIAGTVTNIIIDISIPISMIENRSDIKMTSKIRTGLEKENRKIRINDQTIIIIIIKIKGNHNTLDLIISVNTMRIWLNRSMTILDSRKSMLDKINNEWALLMI